MKQAKSGAAAIEPSKQQLQTAVNMPAIQQPAKPRYILSDMVKNRCFKKFQSLASRQGLRLSSGKTDDESGSDEDREFDEREIESSFYKIFEGGKSSPLVEEFLRNIKEDDEDIEIFVESLSSLAKKSLYEDEAEQKNVVAVSSGGKASRPKPKEVESPAESKALAKNQAQQPVQKTKAEKLNLLIKEFEKQQKEKQGALDKSSLAKGSSTDKKRPNEGGKLTLHYVVKSFMDFKIFEFSRCSNF